MDKKKAHALRKRLDSRLIKLIAPKGMSVVKYKIQCDLNEINATVEDGAFLHWVMTAKDGDETDVKDKVINMLVNALEKKYLLDFDSKEQCAYFCDAIRDVFLEDKERTTMFLEAVLKNYKGSDGFGAEVFEYCKTLNKAFGFTRVEYFDQNLLDAFKKCMM